MKAAAVIFIRTSAQWEMAEEVIAAIPPEVDLCVVNAAVDPLDRVSWRERPVEWLTYLDRDFRGKTRGLVKGIRQVLATGEYDCVYGSMADVVLQPGAFDKLVEDLEGHPECGVTTPLFYTNGKLNIDGQWPGMHSGPVYHFELLSFMIRAEAADVLPDHRSLTGWANCFEWPMRIWESGWEVRKCIDAVAVHGGASTHGIFPGRFASRREYQRSGSTELRELARWRHGGDIAGPIKQLARVRKKHRLSDESYRRAFYYLSWQFYSLSMCDPMPPPGGPKRVAFVFWALNQGGVEKLWAMIGDYFRSIGWEVFFIFWDQERIPHPDFDGHYVINLRPRSLSKSIPWLIRSLGIDTVIYYAHSRELLPILRDCDVRIVEYLAGRLGENILRVDRNGVCCVFEAPSGMEEYGRHQNLSRAKAIEHIRQPVEIPRDKKKRKRAKIIRIGRIDDKKNPGLFGEISKKFNGKYEFVWIGGPEQGEEALFEKMERLYPEVDWRGNVNERHLIMEDLQSSVVSVSTTRIGKQHTEGISNAILESLAAGTPVIATDNGYTKDAVITGETGVLLKNESPEAFVDAIGYIEGAGEKYWEEHCRAFVTEHHGMAAQLEKWRVIVEGN